MTRGQKEYSGNAWYQDIYCKKCHGNRRRHLVQRISNGAKLSRCLRCGTEGVF